MKRIFLIILAFSILFLVGCNTKKENNDDLSESISKQAQEEIIASGENVSNESGNDKVLLEEEHLNPYMKYSPLWYYYANLYEGYITELANGIGVDSLAVKSIDELQILRNLPFAKKGHDFKNADLAEFFSNEPWYQKIEGKEVTLTELSSDEQKALSIIDKQIQKHKELENSLPKYEYDSKKEIVYSFYESDKFKFPYINIDSDNVKNLNKDILTWAMPTISGAYFECESAKYKYYLNDDVLTVIIEESSEYGGQSGFHYNIDIETGKFVSNSDILLKNDVEIEKILNLKDKLLNSVIDNDNNKKLMDYYFYFGSEYQKDESLKNIADAILNNPEEWTLVYIDAKQQIHVILELPTIAGNPEGTIFVDCIVEFNSDENHIITKEVER